MRYRRLLVLLPLFLIGAIGGCSWFGKSTPKATARTVQINISTSGDVNPDAAGVAQPVKVCVVESRQPGWLPDVEVRALPCKRLPSGAEIVSSRQSIIPPGGQQDYRFSVPLGEERWWVVAAEFQRMGGARSVIELTSPNLRDEHIQVTVRRSALFSQRVANTDK
jgi:type VI secretion system protein VasD